VGALAAADNNGPRGELESVPAPRPVGIPDVLDRPPGYHRLHPNVSVNFQLNRWLGWMTPPALPEVAAAAAGARGYPELTSAFLDLGDRLLTQGRRLDAAFCYRAAEFFLLPGDERRALATLGTLYLALEPDGIAHAFAAAAHKLLDTA
jgi:hypothetical protein